MRKPKHRENRTDILQASFEFLAKSGLENISMRELCKGIDISIGSVYYWFENKEQLIADTAEYGLLTVSDDIYTHAFKNICDLHSSFEICLEKMEEHRKALRFIYQLASSPVYGDIIGKRCDDLEPVYHEYAIHISKALDLPVDITLPLVYLFVSAVMDYAIWGDREKTGVQLNYIYKRLVETKV